MAIGTADKVERIIKFNCLFWGYCEMFNDSGGKDFDFLMTSICRDGKVILEEGNLK